MIKNQILNRPAILFCSHKNKYHTTAENLSKFGKAFGHVNQMEIDKNVRIGSIKLKTKNVLFPRYSEQKKKNTQVKKVCSNLFNVTTDAQFVYIYSNDGKRKEKEVR